MESIQESLELVWGLPLITSSRMNHVMPANKISHFVMIATRFFGEVSFVPS